MLSAEQILAKNDLKTKKLKIDEWGGEVIITEFNAAERQKHTEIFGKEGLSSDEVIARVVALGLVAEDGSRLFTEEQVEGLRKKSAVVLERIVKEILTINGLGEAAVEDAKGN